ncbi:MAG: hypothetical protein ACTTJW_06760 [Sphaerochaeta sp.]
MEQLELFDYRIERHNFDQSSIDTALATSRRCFYRRSEVAAMCRTTYSVVRQAIDKMKLDAIYVGGEYRVPSISIHDWISDLERIDYMEISYDEWVNSRVIPGACKISALCNEGFLTKEAACGMLKNVCSKALADKIIDTDFIAKYNAAAPTIEDNPEDYYGLERLDLPSRAELSKWAMLLCLDVKVLKKLGNWQHRQVINWKEMKDFLVRSEVVNLPVFEQRQQRPCMEEEPCISQPMLF